MNRTFLDGERLLSLHRLAVARGAARDEAPSRGGRQRRRASWACCGGDAAPEGERGSRGRCGGGGGGLHWRGEVGMRIEEEEEEEAIGTRLVQTAKRVDGGVLWVWLPALEPPLPPWAFSAISAMLSFRLSRFWNLETGVCLVWTFGTAIVYKITTRENLVSCHSKFSSLALYIKRKKYSFTTTFVWNIQCFRELKEKLLGCVRDGKRCCTLTRN